MGDRTISGYVEPMERRLPPILRTALLIVATALASGSLCADEKPSPPSDLPGVEGEYRIVRPAPPAEPEPGRQSPAPSDATTGRWDVTVSGTLTVDVGVGDLPLPRR
jgi:hypothetical protein